MFKMLFILFWQRRQFICNLQYGCWAEPESEPTQCPPLYLLTCQVANGDVLCLIVDGIEGFVGLQTESGDGQENEEE